MGFVRLGFVAVEDEGIVAFLGFLVEARDLARDIVFNVSMFDLCRFDLDFVVAAGDISCSLTQLQERGRSPFPFR